MSIQLAWLLEHTAWYVVKPGWGTFMVFAALCISFQERIMLSGIPFMHIRCKGAPLLVSTQPVPIRKNSSCKLRRSNRYRFVRLDLLRITTDVSSTPSIRLFML